MKRFISFVLTIVLLIVTTVTGSCEESLIFELPIEELDLKVVRTEQNQTIVFENKKINATKYYFEDGSYALISDDETCYRIDRIDTINKHYSYGKPVDELSDNFEAQNAIHRYMLDNGYALVESYQFDINTQVLRYEKLLDKDIYDTFDAFIIFWDNNYDEPVYISKNSVEHGMFDTEKLISKDEAIRFANKYVQNPIDVELRTMKGNEVFNEISITNDIVLAYVIRDQYKEVYIDADNGVVIGGDIYKTVHGGSFATTDFSTSANSAAQGAALLRYLGYNEVIQTVSTDLVNVLPSYIKQGFYICSHGGPDSLSTLDTSTNNRFYRTSLASLGREYSFVFLDACSTAQNSDWSNDFGITSGAIGKAFIGWTTKVGATSSYCFLLQFCNNVMSSMSIRSAAIQAMTDIIYFVPLGFTGDVQYDGYYYCF